MRHVYVLSNHCKATSCKVSYLSPTSQYHPHSETMEQYSTEVCYHLDIGNKISSWYRYLGPFKVLEMKLYFAIFIVQRTKSFLKAHLILGYKEKSLQMPHLIVKNKKMRVLHIKCSLIVLLSQAAYKVWEI